MRIGSNGALSGLSWLFCQFYVLLGPLPSIYHWIEAMKQDSFSKKPSHPKLGPNPSLQISSNRVCFSAQPRPSTPSCSTNLVCFSAPRLLLCTTPLVAAPLLVGVFLCTTPCSTTPCSSTPSCRSNPVCFSAPRPARQEIVVLAPEALPCFLSVPSNLIPLHTTHIFIDHILMGVFAQVFYQLRFWTVSKRAASNCIH